MSDLRKAAEMALEALDSCSEEEDYDGEWFNSYDEDLVREAKEALRQALSQPEQEPVVWVVQYKDRHEFVWGSKPEFRGGTALAFQPLYMAPPKREWVDLTEDEINHTPVRWTMINGPGDYLLPFARAIEAKLKEKNT